jgi:anaerobic magnesium-protoporphyrin IX monomethyl ester cyclase
MTLNNKNVLFIYPTLFKVTGLPIGIASMSAVLKKGGFRVKVFDTAFYDLSHKQDGDKIRADRLMSKRIINEDKHWKVKTTDIKQDLINVINEFKPKIIGISMLEPDYEISLTLTRLVKQRFKDIIIVAGGVFPTLSPEIVIKESSIDIVCLGEGETALLELCNRVAAGVDYHDIAGLWIKSSGKIIKNKPGALHDVNALPHPDFTGFDEGFFYKPMQGKLYKMVNIETSRGCPYSCSYCSGPKLKKFFLDNNCGKYYRNMSMEKVFEQLYYQIEKHSPEFIYFSSETFLAMTDKEFKTFIEEYRKIKIPFWFQTRFETLKDEHIRLLKEVGMFWLTLGVEHGDEAFRKRILNRTCTNKAIYNGISILNKYDFGASLNNIMGFPFETRELIFETIKLNKGLYEINKKLEFNIFMFVPYLGSELYSVCKDNGLLPDREYSYSGTLDDETVLNFPEEYKRELKGLIKTFNLYVKLPEKYYPQIKIAEHSDEEGDAMFNRLSRLVEEGSF